MLDGCKKVTLVFESVVAGIDLVNCISCKVQVTRGESLNHDKCMHAHLHARMHTRMHACVQVKTLVQTISIDKCDGTQLILNKESLGAEVCSRHVQ